MRLSLPLLFSAVLLGACLIAPAAQAQIPSKTMARTVSLQSLLQELTDADALAKWPGPAYTNREASSYDRRTVAPGQPGWTANDDFSQFIRIEEKNGRQEKVMMEADGPGALVRFWLTAGAPKKGKLRIYLDGANEPSLIFNGFDMEAGPLKNLSTLLYRHDSYSAGAGGNTLYLPIPYAKHCKVTWEEGEKAGQRYYQINYRTYPQDTPVTTWTPQQQRDTAQFLTYVGQKLASPPQASEGEVSSLNETLVAGKSWVRSLDLPAGPAAIRNIELVLNGSIQPFLKDQILRSIIVRISFDGERTVECPATDFFGSGAGINPIFNTFQSVSPDGTMRCRWVMPYKKRATISLENLAGQDVQASLHVTTSPWKWDERSMLFHADWHYQDGIKAITIPETATNTAKPDWNFNTISGKGVYVGDSLAIFNTSATWYGEGDEKIFVDGESFPSHMGTGTEDYYGYSYAPRPVFQTPFVNHTRIDSPSTQGMNVMARVRPLDAIPFQKSLKFDIETISWVPTTLTYAVTTYWYGFPGASSSLKPQLAEATRRLPTLADAVAGLKLSPTALEAETLKVVAHSPSFTPETQDMSPWDRDRWSRGKQLLGKAAAIGDFVEIEVPTLDDTPRQIVVYPTQASDYGTLKFTVNGQASDAVFDGYAPQVQPGRPVRLGIFAPKDRKYLVRIEISGANPKAEKGGTLFGIDYLELALR